MAHALPSEPAPVASDPPAGGERIAPANGIELAYEEFGDPAGEPMVLIMGLATQMIFWDRRTSASCSASAATG